MLRDGVMVETVYVPPSSLRGRLRHLLTAEVMRLQNAGDGRVFTPEDHIDTALGGVKDRKGAGEDDRVVDLAAIRALRERDPIVSLFGSMVSRVAGRLMVGDMTPMDPVAPVGTGRSVRANPKSPHHLAACRIPVWCEIGESGGHDAVHSVQPRPGVPAAAGCQGLASGR